MAETFAFTIGGTVQASSGIYIRRAADEQLLRLCLNGKYAYILSARQVGKSSLMVNVARELRRHGMQAATLDLTSIGQDHVDAESWYCGILYEIERKLGLSGDVFAWWDQRPRLTLSARFIEYLRDVILPRVSGRLIVFLDEIDTTLGLKFTDDFFAAIRMLYNMRAEEPELERLSFVLIGVAVPTDLIKHIRRTPFNIAEHVDLEDFRSDEARPLAEGIPVSEDQRQLILDRVLYWTGGHPYLTQRLLRAIASEERTRWGPENIDAVVERTFLGDQSVVDSNLEHVARRLSAQGSLAYRMLSIYRSVLRSLPPVLDNDRNLAKSYLKLSGVVKRKGAFLLVRNRIYEKVFNAAWVKEQRAVVQERATRHAVFAAGLVSVIALGLGIYSAIQRHAAEQSRLDAVRERDLKDEAVRQKGAAERAQVQITEALMREKQLKDEAEKQTEIAKSKTREAEANRLAAERSAEAQAESAKKAKQAADAAAESAREAQVQRELAEKNYLDAQSAAREADIQRAAAETSFKAAEEARLGEARAQAERAQESAERLLGLKLVPDADLLRLQEPDRIEDGILLDIEAYRRTPGIETQQALHSGLDKLLARVASLPPAADLGTIALSPDSGVLAIAKSNEVLSYGLPALKAGGTLSGAGKARFLAVTSTGITAADTTGQVHRPNSPNLPLNEPLLAIGQNGETVATVSADGKRIAYWRDGRQIGTAKHSSKVILAQFRGAYLDTLTEDYYFTEWGLLAGERLFVSERFQLPKETQRPTLFAYYRRSRSNQGIAVASGPNVRIFSEQINLQRGRGMVFSRPRLTMNSQQYALLRHENAITALAIDPNTRFVATASRDRTVRLWSLATGLEITRIRLDKPVIQMVLGGDGRSLAVMEDGGAISVYSTEPGSAIARNALGSSLGVSFLPDGNRIALLGGSSFPNQRPDQIWDWRRDSKTDILGHDRRYTAVLSTAGAYRLELSAAAPTQLVAKAAGTRPPGSPATFATIFSNMLDGSSIRLDTESRDLSLSADGHYAAFLVSGMLRVIDTKSNKEVPGFAIGDLITGIAVNSNGPTLASSERGTLRILAAGQSPVVVPVGLTVGRPSFSPDGKLIAIVTPNEGRIYSTAGLLVGRIPRNGLREMVFSADNLYLAAVVASDGSAHLWETTSGREVGAFPGISAPVERVAFSPDARYIATTASDGTRVWIWRPEDLVAEACNRVRKPQLDVAVWNKYLPGEKPQATCPAR